LARLPWLTVWVLALGLLPDSAWAHTIGLSRGEYSLQAGTARARLILARGDAIALLPSIDGNGDKQLDPSELAREGAALASAGLDRLRWEGAACTRTQARAKLLEEDGIELWGEWTCRPATTDLRLTLGLFDTFAFGHRHMARVTGPAGPLEHVLFRARASVAIPQLAASPAAAPSQQASGTGAEAITPAPQAVSEGDVLGRAYAYLLLGLEHILFGIDHLVFLLGLVLLGGPLRSLALVVTAFTLAHSVSLGLAVLGVWAPSSAVVEPLIGLSIAWVGVENLLGRPTAGRWRVALPFGFIHGFGFAGALGEIELPRAQVPLALASFNIGVELGQLGVLLVVIPLLLLVRRAGPAGVRVLQAVNIGILIAGLVWFVARVWPGT